MSEPLDLEAAVACAWRMTAEQLPGVRLVIDRTPSTPDPEMAAAMNRAREKEWVRLATAAGLANDEGAAAVAAGRRVEERARAGLAAPRRPDRRAQPKAAQPPRPPSTTPARSRSFVDRIKAVLAA